MLLIHYWVTRMERSVFSVKIEWGILIEQTLWRSDEREWRSQITCSLLYSRLPPRECTHTHTRTLLRSSPACSHMHSASCCTHTVSSDSVWTVHIKEEEAGLGQGRAGQAGCCVLVVILHVCRRSVDPCAPDKAGPVIYLFIFCSFVFGRGVFLFSAAEA